MNQKCVPNIEKLATVFGDLAVALETLADAIKDEDDDKLDQAMDMFPTRAHLGSGLEKLGLLIQQRPWEPRKKKANA